MNTVYKFYVEMDGQVFGPYSARQIRALELLDDILVTEESMNGQWLPAGNFDFDDMVRKEAAPSIPRRLEQQLAATPQPQAPTQSLNNESHQDVRIFVQQPPTPAVAPQNVRVNPDGSVTTLSNWGTESIPEEAYKWNWGAFYFGWFWGIFNGVYWPLLTLLVIWIPFVGLIFGIVLGANGSKWSWKGKRWNSVEHFKRVQHNWAVAALICFLITICMSILYFVALSSL